VISNKLICASPNEEGRHQAGLTFWMKV